MHILFALFILAIVFYPVGARFIGRPMAEFSWRFWTKTPHQSPNVWSWLLYPVAHAHPDWMRSPRSIQEFAIPDHSPCIYEQDRHMPPIGRYVRAWRREEGCGTLKFNWTHSCHLSGCSEYWDWHRDRYLTAASMLWLPRLMVLVPLHLIAATLRIAYRYNSTGWLNFARMVGVR